MERRKMEQLSCQQGDKLPNEIASTRRHHAAASFKAAAPMAIDPEVYNVFH